MSRTIIGPRVMIRIGFAASPSTSRHARVSLYRPSAGWYGSVAAPIATISRCPRRPRELAPQHLGDVRLDADARAVAVVRRTVGALLERAHITERAAVDAAHVRVERPAEAHPLHPVECGAARLFAILDGHPRGPSYRTYVRNARRGRAGDPPPDAAAADRAAARPLLLPARRRRLDARRHRARPDGDAVGRDPRAGRRAGRADLHHAHASRITSAARSSPPLRPAHRSSRGGSTTRSASASGDRTTGRSGSRSGSCATAFRPTSRTS